LDQAKGALAEIETIYPTNPANITHPDVPVFRPTNMAHTAHPAIIHTFNESQMPSQIAHPATIAYRATIAHPAIIHIFKESQIQLRIAQLSRIRGLFHI
jgi:hypothetical protein